MRAIYVSLIVKQTSLFREDCCDYVQSLAFTRHWPRVIRQPKILYSCFTPCDISGSLFLHAQERTEVESINLKFEPGALSLTCAHFRRLESAHSSDKFRLLLNRTPSIAWLNLGCIFIGASSLQFKSLAACIVLIRLDQEPMVLTSSFLVLAAFLLGHV